SYRFLHDRVRQAAYSLIDDSRKAEVHLRIGRLMLANASGTQRDDLFEVASHLNLGAGLITDREERLSLAHLNLEAGKRARAAMANSVAAGYLAAGIAMLDAMSWEHAYELS